MHQALYRKWRPTTFADVCGQEHVTSILRWQLENGRTSHAYLFTGSRGTGKTTCAKILAKAVNCLNPQSGNPCGECDACKAASSGSCIDIIEMDAASNNGVDDIRQIRDEVEYLPAELKKKVYIIDEVHMLSQSAFNALLKTLEEPPEHIVFILATTELQKIPATILSRCQRFDFRRISADVIADRLATIAEGEGFTIDREAGIMLAHLAEGGMRDAISLLELCSGENRPINAEVVESVAGSGGRESIKRILEAVCDRNFDAIFAEIEDAFASSRDLTVLWQELIAFYRDMLVVKTTKEPKVYLELSERQYTELVDIAGRFATETVIAHSKLLDSSLETMRRASADKRLTAEMTLIKMCDERFSSTNESLMSRIAALEERLKGGVTVQTVQTPAEAAETVEPKPSPTPAPIQSEAPPPTEAPTPEPEKPAPTPPPPQAPASGVKKEYKQLPYWADFVEKCTERDAMLGSFMRETAKGFTVNTDSLIHIRTSNQMAQMIITNMYDILLEVLNGFEDGRLDRTSVKLEYAPEKKADKPDIIDEIIKNSEELSKNPD